MNFERFSLKFTRVYLAAADRSLYCFDLTLMFVSLRLIYSLCDLASPVYGKSLVCVFPLEVLRIRVPEQ